MSLDAMMPGSNNVFSSKQVFRSNHTFTGNYTACLNNIYKCSDSKPGHKRNFSLIRAL